MRYSIQMFYLKQNGNFIWIEGCVYTCITTIEFEMRFSVAVLFSLLVFFFNKLRTIHRSCKYETMEQNKQWAGLYSFESENEKCSCKAELLNRNCMIFVFQSTQAGVCMIKWKGLFAVEILLNSKLNAGKWKVISVKYFGITCLHNCTVREYIANYDSVDNSLSCFISVWF